MWEKQILLAVIGLSAGLIVAGGLFSFISSLGVISDIADRTHTGNRILLYQDATVVGGIVGNLFSIYQFRIPFGDWFMGTAGLFSGIFVGCWAMALAETLNVFPVFIRRVKLLQFVPYIILGIAIGKGIGTFIFSYLGW